MRAPKPFGIHARPASGVRVAPLHFTAVRNPYDRAVSHWAFNCLEGRANEWLSDVIGENGGDPHLFKDYLRFGLCGDIEDWRLWNQVQWQETFLVDTHVHIENLRKELSAIVGPVDVRQLNTSKRGPWRDYYDDEAIEMIRPWATPDCERFGYDVLGAS